MSKEVLYKQCRLERASAGGAKAVLVSWLPERFAAEGMTLRLRGRGGWVDGWRVVSASGPSEPEQRVSVYNRAHLKQRQASDV